MAQYIFYTHDGVSIAPNGENIENLQILGMEDSLSQEDAIQKLFNENKWIKENDFKVDNIKCLAVMKPEMLEKLKEVIEYLWIGEERHWEECGSPNQHIFQTLKDLRNIL